MTTQTLKEIDTYLSIHDWELIKKERKRDYDKINNN